MLQQRRFPQHFSAGGWRLFSPIWGMGWWPLGRLSQPPARNLRGRLLSRLWLPVFMWSLKRITACYDGSMLLMKVRSRQKRLRPLIKEVACMRAKSLQPCPALWDPMDCSPPGSSVHGNLQAKTPEWVAVPSSGGSSRPRGRTRVSYVSCTGRRVLCH